MSIATLTIDINAKLASLEKDMGRAAHIAEQNARRMESAFNGAKTALAGIGAALTVGAFASMIKGVADAGDHLQKLSVKTGVAVEELSKLQYAASLSDVSNDELGASLSRLNKVMGEAADGSKEATSALARFGIAPGSMNTIEAFKQIAERVKNTGDATKVASGLTDIFGKSYAQLIPLLKSGADSLKSSGDELERLGGVISGDLAKSAEEFNDNLTRIGKSLDVLKISAGGPVIKSLESLTTKFIEATKAAGGFWSGLATWGMTSGAAENAPGAAIADLVWRLAKLKEMKQGLEAPTLANKLGFNAEDIAIVNKQISVMTTRIEYLKGLNNKSVDGYQDRWVPQSRGAEIAATTTPTSGSKVVAEKISEGERLIQQLKDRLATQLHLSEVEKLSASFADDRYKRMTAGEKDIALLLAGQLDARVLVNNELDTEIDRIKEIAREHDAQDSRLKSLAASTDIGKNTQNMLDESLAEAALRSGKISEAVYDQIIVKLHDVTEAGKDSAGTMSTFAEQAARNMQDAFADFLFDPFAGGVGEMARNFGTMVQRMVANAAAADLAKRMFGKASGGDGNGWVGQGLDWLAGVMANANGNVFSSPALSAYSGTVVSRPTVFPFASGIGLMGEAGAEAILPLKRGPDGKLGVSAQGGGGQQITIIQHLPAGTPVETRRAAGQGAREALSVMAGARRYA